MMFTPKLLTLIGRNEHAEIAKKAVPSEFSTVHFYSVAKELVLMLPRELETVVKRQMRELGKTLTEQRIPYKVVYK